MYLPLPRIFASLSIGAWMGAWAAGADIQIGKTGALTAGKISPEMSAVLLEEGLQVSTGGKTLGQFWLRKELPTAAPAGGLGISFGQIPVGTLVGVVEFAQEWHDYRKQPVAAGTYTLRYGVQPADGNHMGVSLYRDFLLIIPTGADAAVEASSDMEELAKLSAKTTGTPHPAILALFPVYDEVSEPKVIKNDMEQATLVVPLAGVTLGLVMEGHGEVE